jgi:signal transduction histidine kinase
MRAADETQLLQHVCQIIVDLGGYRMTWVGLAEQDAARTVRPVAMAGHEDGYLTAVNFTWADDERGRGPTGTAIRTAQPFIARNIPTDPHFAPWHEQVAHRGYVSSIALPLLSSGRAFGALNIYAVEPDAFDDEEVKLLTEMADDLSYGIVALRTRAERRRAEEQIQRLNQDLERRARGLAALNQAGQIMASTLDLNTLLERVMERVSRLLDAEGTSVLLRAPALEGDTTELVFAAATGAASARLLGKRLPGDTGIVGWVMQKKQPALVADAQSDPRFDRRVDADTGLTTHSVLAMPLISKGEILGVVEAVNKMPAGGHAVFDQHDVEMLMALTSSAAIAIENARLYATEQERVAALARALEQQRALDRLQRQFIQNVSHELRTPLAIIRGHAELLEIDWFGPLQPEQRESISIILRRTQMLTRMVDDVVSILEMESRELKREPIDMAQLVSLSVADFQATAQKGGLALVAEIAPGLQPISGDSMAWRRVLDNLVGNACKFTAAGGRVTVRLWQGAEGTHLQVADTGIGIAPEHLGRIFERFYQVDGTSTRRYGGIGLGLALVKEITEAHGGQVTVESQVGAGTTFTILLPMT